MALMQLKCPRLNVFELRDMVFYHLLGHFQLFSIVNAYIWLVQFFSLLTLPLFPLSIAFLGLRESNGSTNGFPVSLSFMNVVSYKHHYPPSFFPYFLVPEVFTLNLIFRGCSLFPRPLLCGFSNALLLFLFLGRPLQCSF